MDICSGKDFSKTVNGTTIIQRWPKEMQRTHPKQPHGTQKINLRSMISKIKGEIEIIESSTMVTVKSQNIGSLMCRLICERP